MNIDECQFDGMKLLNLGCKTLAISHSERALALTATTRPSRTYPDPTSEHIKVVSNLFCGVHNNVLNRPYNLRCHFCGRYDFFKIYNISIVLIMGSGGATACVTAGRLAEADPSLKILVSLKKSLVHQHIF